MEEIPSQVLAQLIPAAPDDTTTIVLMTCGISGSGKSTLAKSICKLKNIVYARPTKGDNEKSRTGPGSEPILIDRGATSINAGSPRQDAITGPTSVNNRRDLPRPFQEREYVRLSIDEYIWNHHGRYGIDYPPEKYSEYQSEASDELDKLFVRLLKNGSQALGGVDPPVPQRPLTIVLDYSFARKTDRDEVKEIVEREGGRWVLVYLAISENRDAIRERVRGRKSKRDVESGSCDGDNAFEVTDGVLDTYLTAFQVPRGEGEIVIH